MKTKILLIFVLIGLLIADLSAQVTIGLGTAPEKAALLELKSLQSVTEGGATTGTNGGGLLLPRAELVTKKDLLPLTSQGGLTLAEYMKLKMRHKALMVYNLTSAGEFNEGIYIWNGEEWTRNTSTHPWYKVGTTVPSVNNTDNSYIMAKIGIGTTSPGATLHINGDMILKQADEMENARDLIIGSDGKVGIKKETLVSSDSKLLFLGTERTIILNDTEKNQVNNNTRYVIPIEASDVVLSNGEVAAVEPTGNIITIKRAGSYDISATLGITPNIRADEVAYIAYNVEKQEAGSSSWVSIAGNRPVFKSPDTAQITFTIPIASIIAQLKVGDRIRLVIYRTRNGPGQLQGNTWGSNGPVSIDSAHGILSVGLKLSKL